MIEEEQRVSEAYDQRGMNKSSDEGKRKGRRTDVELLRTNFTYPLDVDRKNRLERASQLRLHNLDGGLI